MRIHVLVEGAAEKRFLEAWFPRFLPGHALTVIEHQGRGRLRSRAKPFDPRRRGLLDQLPEKLRAYGKGLNPATDRVLVLLDLDKSDCKPLKRRLLRLLEDCSPRPEVLFRFAVEELEAFFLGDPAALRRAFPAVKLGKLRDYEQDSICDTDDLFAKMVGSTLVDKPEWAGKMGLHLGVAQRGKSANRSPSFHKFCRAFARLAGEEKL